MTVIQAMMIDVDGDIIFNTRQGHINQEIQDTIVRYRDTQVPKTRYTSGNGARVLTFNIGGVCLLGSYGIGLANNVSTTALKQIII